MRAAATAHQQEPPIYIETPNYYVRLLKAEDANERVAAWFDQPDVREGINLAPDRRMTKESLADYFASFGDHTNVLTGRFRKSDNVLIAISNVQVNREIGRFLMNLVVGEPEHRHRGSTLEVLVPSLDFCFETRDLKVMTATALAFITFAILKTAAHNIAFTCFATNADTCSRIS